MRPLQVCDPKLAYLTQVNLELTLNSDNVVTGLQFVNSGKEVAENCLNYKEPYQGWERRTEPFQPRYGNNSCKKIKHDRRSHFLE